jgi:hypothetical protein
MDIENLSNSTLTFGQSFGFGLPNKSVMIKRSTVRQPRYEPSSDLPIYLFNHCTLLSDSVPESRVPDPYVFESHFAAG